MSRDTFIIAEIGSNWHSLGDISDSIQMAKMCGADAAKLQIFTQEELYGFDCNLPRDFELKKEWLPQLCEKAQACGIELMVTAFSRDGYDLVNPYVKRHKIASSENGCPDLFEKVLSLKKPIIYSCGGSTPSEVFDFIRRSIRTYNSVFSTSPILDLDLTLMYCVSSYPALETDLFKMDYLNEIACKPLKAKLGLSDHSLDYAYIPKAACHFHHARVIEKHFRLNRITDTPDSGHSLDVPQFKKMVDSIRKSPYHDSKSPYRSPEENLAGLLYRRRIIALKDIRKGERFEFGKNYGFFRPRSKDEYGSSPRYIESKDCLREVKKGSSIGWKDVDHFEINPDSFITERSLVKGKI